MLKIVCIPLKWLINLICFGMTPSRVKDVKESLLQTLEGVYKGVHARQPKKRSLVPCMI